MENIRLMGTFSTGLTFLFVAFIASYISVQKFNNKFEYPESNSPIVKFFRTVYGVAPVVLSYLIMIIFINL